MPHRAGAPATRPVLRVLAVFWEGEELLSWHPAAPVDVVGPDIFRPPPGIVLRSPVYLDLTWESGPV